MKKVTIKQFQQLESLRKEETIGNFDKEVRFAAIILNMTNEQADELPMSKVMQVNKNYVTPQAKDRIPKRTFIGGRLFQVIPDFTLLNAGEFTAFEHFTRTPNTTLNELHNIVALLTREVKFPYLKQQPRKEDPDTYLKRAIFMQDNAPAELAMTISGFFLRVWNQSYNLILEKDGPNPKD